jgi:hypothetical protein
MKNNLNDRLLVDGQWIVYKEIVKNIVKLDCDGVVRSYEKCESINEGLLG